MFTVIYGSKSFSLVSSDAASRLRQAHHQLMSDNAEEAESLKAQALRQEAASGA